MKMKALMPVQNIFIPPALAAVLLLLLSALFSGCYTLKQGASLIGYLGKAVPLESLESESDRLFAERVYDIRRFAMTELGLKESKNYTKYVDIDRDYLAAVVSASADDSFTRHEWWFPVIGRVPYKGFFNVNDARKEREKLENKGLDVWVRGVGAFSTLGWFRDPLYSYMKNYPVDSLADLIIHELFHATVFIKNQVQFNEELAEFVGSEGSRLYMESRFGAGTPESRRIDESEADNAAFIAFIRRLIAELEELYKSGAEASGGPGREELLRRKAEIIAAAQERFDNEYDSLFSGENFRGFSTMKINNAYLELYRLYYAEDNFFSGLYERSGKNLPAFIAAAKTLQKSAAARRHPRRQLEAALTGGR
jgi:predicted aminopeptidase